MKKKISFEEKLNLLEQIVSDMENNKYNLSELIKVNDQAKDILKDLESELNYAKQKFFVIEDGDTIVQKEI